MKGGGGPNEGNGNENANAQRHLAYDPKHAGHFRLTTSHLFRAYTPRLCGNRTGEGNRSYDNTLTIPFLENKDSDLIKYKSAHDAREV